MLVHDMKKNKQYLSETGYAKKFDKQFVIYKTLNFITLLDDIIWLCNLVNQILVDT